MPTPKKRAVTKTAPPPAKAARSSKPRGEKPDAGETRTDPAVVAFLDGLEHPLKKELVMLRELLLDASPEIREGIKWNAPSFRTTEYFATFNLRTQDRLRLILHMGAKAKDTATTGLAIADPSGLLEWLAKDRALVTFHGAKDIQSKKTALQALVRDWIRWV
ncbi:MAG: DUF1801 domain-containing protein [Cystobacter sp.]